MRLSYFPDTDSLYIDLVDRPAFESEEVSEGVVVDYDAEGALVGIEVDGASTKIDLTRLVLDSMPAKIEVVPVD